MNRETARLQNLTTYNTGIPCSRGHNSDRYTSTGHCIECLKKYADKHKSRHAIYKLVEERVHPADMAIFREIAAVLRAQRKLILDEEFKQASAVDSFGRPR